MQSLSVEHNVSSPYHSESQSSLERFHDRKWQSRVCHINMIKAYHSRDLVSPQVEYSEVRAEPSVCSVASATTAAESALVAEEDDEDGLVLCNASHQCFRFDNSAILADLPAHLSHLPADQRHAIVTLGDS